MFAAAGAPLPDSGAQAYDQGVAAFKVGHYRQALEKFLAARDRGVHAPQLDYDLGVTYYRLGRYQDARREFTALLSVPGAAALSHYNLGLIALRQQDLARARREFELAYAGAREPGLRALASTALETLGAAPAPATQWTAFADAGAGYDSNVALTSESTTLTPAQRGSSVYSLLAGAIDPLGGDEHRGWQVVGTYYRIDYPSVTQYDQTYLHLGGDYRWENGSWSNQLGVYAGNLTLGSAQLETLGTVSADTRYATAAGNLWHFSYRYTRIFGGGNYAYLSGWHQSLGVENTLKYAHSDLTLGYNFDFNERNNYNAPPDFFSASPTINGLYAIFNWRLSDTTSLYLEADYAHSHYEGADSVLQNGVNTQVFREDNWWNPSLGFKYALSAHWLLRLDCSYMDNRSNIPVYSYHSSQAMVTFEYLLTH